jgi:hypothetical protein
VSFVRQRCSEKNLFSFFKRFNFIKNYVTAFSFGYSDFLYNFEFSLMLTIQNIDTLKCERGLFESFPDSKRSTQNIILFCLSSGLSHRVLMQCCFNFDIQIFQKILYDHGESQNKCQAVKILQTLRGSKNDNLVQ